MNNLKVYHHSVKVRFVDINEERTFDFIDLVPYIDRIEGRYLVEKYISDEVAKHDANTNLAKYVGMEFEVLEVE